MFASRSGGCLEIEGTAARGLLEGFGRCTRSDSACWRNTSAAWHRSRLVSPCDRSCKRDRPLRQRVSSRANRDRRPQRDLFEINSWSFVAGALFPRWAGGRVRRDPQAGRLSPLPAPHAGGKYSGSLADQRRSRCPSREILARRKKVGFNRLVAGGGKPGKLPHRVDYQLTWQQDATLDAENISGADSANHAHARFELDVLGDEPPITAPTSKFPRSGFANTTKPRSAAPFWDTVCPSCFSADSASQRWFCF